MKGTQGFVADLTQQSEAVGKRSPVQARLAAAMRVLLDGEVGARLADAWADRDFTIFYERPLLLLAALRFDALGEGPAHPLDRALRDVDPDPGALDETSLLEALAPERPVWRSLAGRFVQTNETSRALIWLWPAALAGATSRARPLALVDVGASAGLNLVADTLENTWTEDGAGPLPVGHHLDVRLRLGLDARPLDVRDDEAARWLTACVWPGEGDRLARLRAGIDAARRAPPRLETVLVRDAPARVERVLAEHPGILVLVYQSIVRDYLEAGERSAYQSGLRALLAAHEPGRLVWLELEIGGEDASRALPCEITAHTGREDLALGRCGYHPGAVRVNHAAVARFTTSVS